MGPSSSLSTARAGIINYAWKGPRGHRSVCLTNIGGSGTGVGCMAELKPGGRSMRLVRKPCPMALRLRAVLPAPPCIRCMHAPTRPPSRSCLRNVVSKHPLTPRRVSVLQWETIPECDPELEQPGQLWPATERTLVSSSKSLCISIQAFFL